MRQERRRKPRTGRSRKKVRGEKWKVRKWKVEFHRDDFWELAMCWLSFFALHVLPLVTHAHFGWIVHFGYDAHFGSFAHFGFSVHFGRRYYAHFGKTDSTFWNQNELLNWTAPAMLLISPICTALADIVLPIQKVWAVFLTHITRYELHNNQYDRQKKKWGWYERHILIHIAALWRVNRQNLTLFIINLPYIIAHYVTSLEIPL